MNIESDELVLETDNDQIAIGKEKLSLVSSTNFFNEDEPFSQEFKRAPAGYFFFDEAENIIGNVIYFNAIQNRYEVFQEAS